mgnify:CR=1 FL=1
MITALTLICGLLPVNITENGIDVSGVHYDYRTTLIEKGTIQHKFTDGVVIRQTKYDRVSYRQIGKGNWRKCTMAIYKGEK